MGFLDYIVVIGAKFVSLVSTTLGLGAGGTWPGEIALTLRPNITRALARKLPDGVILIAGTNGKTTTALMVTKILEAHGKRVVHNATGANLLNGIVSALIRNQNATVGVFEVDENSLPIALKYFTPKRVVLLNLFRDQLDRYGEVDVIIEKWKLAFDSGNQHNKQYHLILNADDPAVAGLGNTQTTYFGLNDPRKFLQTKEHATDSTFCLKCGSRLTYDGVYYSHIGIWRCTKCGNRRPEPDVSHWPTTLPGLYNQYNTLAAVALAKSLDIPDNDIKKSLKDFSPAFGRQEEIGTIKIFLSKNPAGFNMSIRTALEMGAKNILLVLNDRIPDGRDVSWIWDVDFEMIPKNISLTVSGDRVYDMALRIKYAGLPATIETELEKALKKRSLFVLATYSAMLEVRKILTGKKI